MAGPWDLAAGHQHLDDRLGATLAKDEVDGVDG
jgi:hypothetical protein